MSIWILLYYHQYIEIITPSPMLFILVFSVIFVIIIKAIRFFIILYGDSITKSDICSLYLKTSIVNTIIPYKLGELFRMYMTGRYTGDYKKGILITLLDRFFDTLGIISIIAGTGIMSGRFSFNFTVFLLIGFLAGMSVLYIAFPSLHTFWNHYLLVNRSTSHRIKGLEVLRSFNELYEEIRTLVRGRGLIMFALSLIAWLLEIFSMRLINQIMHLQIDVTISQYLYNLMAGSGNAGSTIYSTVSIFLLVFFLAVYCLVKIVKGNRECRK